MKHCGLTLTDKCTVSHRHARQAHQAGTPGLTGLGCGNRGLWGSPSAQGGEIQECAHSLPLAEAGFHERQVTAGGAPWSAD